MISADDVAHAVAARVDGPEQEKRIRDLYERARAASVKQVLAADRAALQKRFDKALKEVKAQTGLF